MIIDALREIRKAWRAAGKHPDDARPRWTQLPIAQVEQLSPRVEMPRYCETVRHRGKRRPATTFHAVVDVPGQPDRAWVACAECTNLMMDDMDAGSPTMLKEPANCNSRSFFPSFLAAPGRILNDVTGLYQRARRSAVRAAK